MSTARGSKLLTVKAARGECRIAEAHCAQEFWTRSGKVSRAERLPALQRAVEYAYNALIIAAKREALEEAIRECDFIADRAMPRSGAELAGGAEIAVRTAEACVKAIRALATKGTL